MKPQPLSLEQLLAHQGKDSQLAKEENVTPLEDGEVALAPEVQTLKEYLFLRPKEDLSVPLIDHARDYYRLDFRIKRVWAFRILSLLSVVLSTTEWYRSMPEDVSNPVVVLWCFLILWAVLETCADTTIAPTREIPFPADVIIPWLGRHRRKERRWIESSMDPEIQKTIDYSFPKMIQVITNNTGAHGRVRRYEDNKKNKKKNVANEDEKLR